ncbi:MAG TPA: CHRD domain-containing protein [Chitinophagaceae bacterium]
MKLIKLTAFPLFLFSVLLSLGSCEKSSEAKKGNLYAKSGILVSGAQVVPVSASPALGSMDVSYIRTDKLLNYKLTYSGLSGTPTGVGLYGLAPVGYGVSPTTPFQVIPLTGLTTSGTISGNLLVDNISVKEENVLNGQYYILIRTAAYPAGEIRGQITFQ